jgi:hypothetical protein
MRNRWLVDLLLFRPFSLIVHLRKLVLRLLAADFPRPNKLEVPATVSGKSGGYTNPVSQGSSYRDAVLPGPPNVEYVDS